MVKKAAEKKNSPSEENAKNATEENLEKAAKEEVKKINAIGFFFKWESLQTDLRQYKPSNPLLVPAKPIHIRVDVPLQNDLIYNAQSISIQQLSNQNESEPFLTPLGMRYIIDQFEAVMRPAQVEEEGEKSSDEEDWGDDEEETTTKEKKSKEAPKEDEEKWDDESQEEEKPGEEDFDEDWS